MTAPALHHAFAKGHGAENDFVILPDPDGHLTLTPAEVVRLCDRCTGLGADGVLRAVRCAADPEGAVMREAEWFMDYRNADGSLGAMCGNGLRLLGRYLVDAGLHRPGALLIATRAGTRRVHVPDHAGPVTVDMGRPRLSGARGIQVTVAGRTWPAVHVDMGNPHAVVFLEDLRLAGDLRTAPTVTPAAAYPHGATVDFVATRGPHHLQLRVHERGVGETRACGTGACAAVAAARAHQPSPPLAVDYTADLPGGRLHIVVRPSGAIDLTGPAIITAQGTLGLTLPSKSGLPAGSRTWAQRGSGESETSPFRGNRAEHTR
ncbi:diaminopimelate epimerase [Streptomyces malaysiensis]|uniref:Diaminopimelate epimerase n=1 Tax=Streptomyces malaysiensis subsp. samsunensis TaxID=459658 RepID=A0A9X2M6R6_STRMQ|nr:diaminopimelate epimerase [Streptomyces samsunensis]MCQ8835810.1 diaminopimelate epimerase [Streptomyces samsunensis]